MDFQWTNDFTPNNTNKSSMVIILTLSKSMGAQFVITLGHVDLCLN